MGYINQSSIAVLSDFDGTLTNEVVLNRIYRQFAPHTYAPILDRWERGEISTMQEVESVFATISANREEMEAILNDVGLDPDLPALLNLCADRQYPFAILSDGLRWYIEYILRRHGLYDVTIYASEIHFNPAGFSFSYPWYDESTPLRSTSKSTIIQDYQQRGYRVVFFGDGLSDLDAVGVADVLFARDGLLNYAKENGYQANPFHNVGDVLQVLKNLGVSP